DLARLVGPTGSVVAVDLQQGMLDRLAAKLAGSDLGRRVHLHRCQENDLGLSSVPFDFVLLFYMVHEVPDPAHLFRQLRPLMTPTGTI
ncbi:class I SAM-dependent methyltransferase, partial [Mycobacterium tuberculosis]|nr:class I SAM-dependent methyltransferase [Mycobacterium tuberculosis]